MSFMRTGRAPVRDNPGMVRSITRHSDGTVIARLVDEDRALMARCEAVLHAPLVVDGPLCPELLNRVRQQLGLNTETWQFARRLADAMAAPCDIENGLVHEGERPSKLASRYPRGRPPVRVQDRRNDPPPPKLCEHCGETGMHFCYNIPGQPDRWRGPLPAWFTPPDPNVPTRR